VTLAKEEAREALERESWSKWPLNMRETIWREYWARLA
jgi:hypothetical protein